MKAINWNLPSTIPDCPGEYRRRNSKGFGSERTYWDGRNWFAISSSGERFSSPHHDQFRCWGVASKLVVDSVKPGDRFGMLTFIRSIGSDTDGGRWIALFACDCGCEKAMNLYEITRGRNKSCGCLRNSDDRLKKWRETRDLSGGSKSPAVMKAVANLAKSNIGKERTSIKVGKSSLNIHAKHFHISHESGVELSGWNLADLVRQNSSLFDEADLVWHQGTCGAVKGLYRLYQKSKPNRLWKGWRRIGDVREGD